MSLRPPVIFYCDLDGVLTNFEDHLLNSFEKIFGSDSDWGRITPGQTVSDLKLHLGDKWYLMTASLPESFWSEMPWTIDGKELWHFVKAHPHIILTTPARGINSRLGKKKWITTELGVDVENIIQPNKHRYVHQNLGVPSHLRVHGLKKVLIDDLPGNIEDWNAQGGIGILHRSTEETILNIRDLFPWLIS